MEFIIITIFVILFLIFFPQLFILMVLIGVGLQALAYFLGFIMSFFQR